jgi:hypothetical protein
MKMYIRWNEGKVADSWKEERNPSLMKAEKERNIPAEMEATGKGLFIQMKTQFAHKCPFLKLFSK